MKRSMEKYVYNPNLYDEKDVGPVLTSKDRAELIKRAPVIINKMDTTGLNAEDICNVLVFHPSLANRLPVEKLRPEHIDIIVRRHGDIGDQLCATARY